MERYETYILLTRTHLLATETQKRQEKKLH